MVVSNTETCPIVGPGMNSGKENWGIHSNSLNGKRPESKEKWFSKVIGFQQRSDLGLCRNMCQGKCFYKRSFQEQEDALSDLSLL